MLSRCESLEADVLMIDLEDSVVPALKEKARHMVAELIASASDTLRNRLWVRINSWQSGLLEEDLSVIGSLMPTGYLLPKARSVQDVTDLDRLLDNLELSDEHRRSRIFAMVTEVPEALMSINSYQAPIPRLDGLAWGAEDLAAALGASANREEDGSWIPTFEYARTQCLLAAACAHTMAYDTVYVDYRDSDGLRHYASKARRDGFDGMLAIHPDQVAIINEAFTPSAKEVDFATEVVQLFKDNPDAGAVGLNGKMLDLPHLYQAERLLQHHRTIQEKIAPG